jgi:hypothetical protein
VKTSSNVGKDLEKMEPYTLMGMQSMESSRRFLKIFKNITAMDPVIPLLGIYPTKLKSEL